MDDQCLGVADIGQMRAHLHRFDELAARLAPSANAEAQDRAGTLGQVTLRRAWCG